MPNGRSADSIASCIQSRGHVTAPETTEPLLAQQSQGIAQDVLSSTRTTFESLLQHTLAALHNHPDANGALAAENAVEALALNLRATQILHRLANHLSERHDHDGAASTELYAIDY